MIEFSNITENARIWVYTSNRFISAEDKEIILTKGYTFLSTWTAHGSELKSAIDIIDDCFLVIAVDEEITSASGCSIDASISFIKAIEKELSINFLDWQNMAYQENNKITLIQRNHFIAELKENKISLHTVIFNTNIQTKKELQTKFKVTLAESNFKNALIGMS